MNKFKWVIEYQIQQAIEEQEDAFIAGSKQFDIEFDDDSLFKTSRSLFFTAKCALREGIYKNDIYVYKRISGFVDSNGVTLMDSMIMGTERVQYND